MCFKWFIFFIYFLYLYRGCKLAHMTRDIPEHHVDALHNLFPSLWFFIYFLSWDPFMLIAIVCLSATHLVGCGISFHFLFEVFLALLSCPACLWWEKHWDGHCEGLLALCRVNCTIDSGVLWLNDQNSGACSGNTINPVIDRLRCDVLIWDHCEKVNQWCAGVCVLCKVMIQLRT